MNWTKLDKEFHDLLKEKAIKNGVDTNFVETSYFHFIGVPKLPKDTCFEIDGTLSVLEIKLILEALQEIKERYFANEGG